MNSQPMNLHTQGLPWSAQLLGEYVIVGEACIEFVVHHVWKAPWAQHIMKDSLSHWGSPFSVSIYLESVSSSGEENEPSQSSRPVPYNSARKSCSFFHMIMKCCVITNQPFPPVSLRNRIHLTPRMTKMTVSLKLGPGSSFTHASGGPNLACCFWSSCPRGQVTNYQSQEKGQKQMEPQQGPLKFLRFVSPWG